jgi:hypothetical protein
MGEEILTEPPADEEGDNQEAGGNDHAPTEPTEIEDVTEHGDSEDDEPDSGTES